jgi:ferredoxin
MNNAIVDLDDELYINPVWCTECGSCAAMCYEDAIGYEGLDLAKENFFQDNITDLSWNLLLEIPV